VSNSFLPDGVNCGGEPDNIYKPGCYHGTCDHYQGDVWLVVCWKLVGDTEFPTPMIQWD